MKYRRMLLGTILVLSLAVLARAQSLGDLARKESERRAKIKEEPKVIGNYDLNRYRAGAVATSNLPVSTTPAKPNSEQGSTTASPPPQGGAQAGAGIADPNESKDLTGRTESFWRQTFADARKKIKELENEANVFTLRINDLQNQFYRESDGFKQQTVSRDLQKTFYEQDQNKENLAKARSALDDLEKEARRSGVLPGWLSPRP